MACELVAPGDGAFLQCSTSLPILDLPLSNTKSSTRLPLAASAWARTPADPRTTSPTRMHGTIRWRSRTWRCVIQDFVIWLIPCDGYLKASFLNPGYVRMSYSSLRLMLDQLKLNHRLIPVLHYWLGSACWRSPHFCCRWETQSVVDLRDLYVDLECSVVHERSFWMDWERDVSNSRGVTAKMLVLFKDVLKSNRGRRDQPLICLSCTRTLKY